MPRIRRLILLLVVFLLLLGLSILSRFFGGFFGEEPVEEPTEEPHRTVVGRVLSSDGSAAPVGTRVAALGPGPEDRPLAETTTRGGGEFRFDALPDATREFLATTGPLSGRAPAGEESPEIRLEATFDAAGLVLDAATSDPVAGAEVRCGNGTAVTDEQGRWKIRSVAAPDGIPPPLEVSSPDHEPLTVRPGPDAPWDDLYLKLTRRN